MIRKSFFMLRSGHSGVIREVMAFVLDESWLTVPKDEHKLVQLVGWETELHDWNYLVSVC